MEAIKGAGGNNKIRGKSGSEYSTMIMVYDPDQLVDRKGHGNCPALPHLKGGCMTEKTYELTPELKAQIDAMTHYDMCSKWRFAKVGDPLLAGETGEYFKKRLFEHWGGFTPAISKALGW